MWMKICGNTRLEDCLFAAECGADAVGFVFAPGKRTVTSAQVAAIAPRLPHALEKIGVFTMLDAGEIVRTAREAGLTGIQLHGPFDLQLTREVRERFHPGAHRRIIQVLHWWTDTPAEEQAEAFAAECQGVVESGLADALLIDSRTRQASGGTGVTFDWHAAKDALAEIDLPVIVAGGLRPQNVSTAVEALGPFGVDVSSGVESAPGKKDPEKVREFVERARTTPDPRR